MTSELPPPHRVDPPSGTAPPTAAPSPVAGQDELDLVALAARVCERYYAEFTDEDAVYGEVGRLWCQHDVQHILNWAALDAAGAVELRSQITWLARVLEARRFPLLRLARSLELAADVVDAELGADAAAMASPLRASATMIRERGTFLED